MNFFVLRFVFLVKLFFFYVSLFFLVGFSGDQTCICAFFSLFYFFVSAFVFLSNDFSVFS